MNKIKVFFGISFYGNVHNEKHHDNYEFLTKWKIWVHSYSYYCLICSPVLLHAV